MGFFHLKRFAIFLFKFLKHFSLASLKQTDKLSLVRRVSCERVPVVDLSCAPRVFLRVLRFSYLSKINAYRTYSRANISCANYFKQIISHNNNVCRLCVNSTIPSFGASALFALFYQPSAQQVLSFVLPTLFLAQ